MVNEVDALNLENEELRREINVLRMKLQESEFEKNKLEATIVELTCKLNKPESAKDIVTTRLHAMGFQDNQVCDVLEDLTATASWNGHEDEMVNALLDKLLVSVNVKSKIAKTGDKLNIQDFGLLDDTNLLPMRQDGSEKLLFGDMDKRNSQEEKQHTLIPQVHALSYADFMDRVHRKASRDILTSMKLFVRSVLGPNGDGSIPVTKMTYEFMGVTNLTKRCQMFLADTSNALRVHPAWRCSNEETLASARDGIEKYVMEKLHDTIMSRTDIAKEWQQRDKISYERMQLLHFVTPKMLDSNLENEVVYSLAKQEMERMLSYRCPGDKLKCIVNSCTIIFKSLHLANDSNHGCPGADEFLPAFIYLVLQSKIPSLFSNCAYIEAFRFRDDLQSKAGYCLVNLRSALEFISYLDETTLTIEPQEYFKMNSTHLKAKRLQDLRKANMPTTLYLDIRKAREIDQILLPEKVQHSVNKRTEVQDELYCPPEENEEDEESNSLVHMIQRYQGQLFKASNHSSETCSEMDRALEQFAEKIDEDAEEEMKNRIRSKIQLISNEIMLKYKRKKDVLDAQGIFDAATNKSRIQAMCSVELQRRLNIELIRKNVLRELLIEHKGGGVQFNKEQKVVAENHDSDSNALGSRLSLHLQKRQEGARRNSSMLKIGKMPPNVDRKISTSKTPEIKKSQSNIQLPTIKADAVSHGTNVHPEVDVFASHMHIQAAITLLEKAKVSSVNTMENIMETDIQTWEDRSPIGIAVANISRMRLRERLLEQLVDSTLHTSSIYSIIKNRRASATTTDPMEEQTDEEIYVSLDEKQQLVESNYNDCRAKIDARIKRKQSVNQQQLIEAKDDINTLESKFEDMMNNAVVVGMEQMDVITTDKFPTTVAPMSPTTESAAEVQAPTLDILPKKKSFLATYQRAVRRSTIISKFGKQGGRWNMEEDHSNPQKPQETNLTIKADDDVSMPIVLDNKPRTRSVLWTKASERILNRNKYKPHNVQDKITRIFSLLELSYMEKLRILERFTTELPEVIFNIVDVWLRAAQLVVLREKARISIKEIVEGCVFLPSALLITEVEVNGLDLDTPPLITGTDCEPLLLWLKAAYPIVTRACRDKLSEYTEITGEDLIYLNKPYLAEPKP